MFKSWRTTLAGVIQFVVLTGAQFQALLDSDPTTIPQWGIITASLLTLIGLGAARDNTVTSEEAKEGE